MSAALLRELDALTHDARMRRMAELGRDPRAARTIAALEKGGFYERLLALQSCYGSRDGAHALRALADPSRTIQSRSLRLIALCCDDGQAREALRGARPGLRLALLRALRRRRRTKPIDAFLNELAGRDPAAAATVMPFGSDLTVARHFASARHLGGSVFWTRLARSHPARAADSVRALLKEQAPPDARLAYEGTTVLGALAERQPDAAVALARDLAKHLPLSRLAFALIVVGIRRPAEVADLLLASSDAVPVSLDRSAHRLDARRLAALLDRRPGALEQPYVWLRRLPPDRRAAAFVAGNHAWRDAEACVNPVLLRWLPGPLRHDEARRHLALPALAARPVQRLPYASLLPWDEARAVLDPWIKHPEGDLRGLALHSLAGTVRFERGRLADLLAMVRARRHEQDPVRGRMLAGLAELPRACWRPEHLDDLGQVLRDALSAADLSAGTAAYAERLVVALLPTHPEWGAEWLATLVRERGHVHLGDLQDRLTEADIRRVGPALLPVLKSWQNRERQGQLVGIAQSFGRRLPAFPELVEILEHEVQATRTHWAAEYHLALLAQHCPDRTAVLIPRLVASDPSWVTRPAVHNYLHRRRQDLLTPFLGQRAFSGRFSTGRTRYLLPLQRGFVRWTPAQQATFLEALVEVARAHRGAMDTPTVLFVIGQLAALPAADVAPLAKLAGNKRPAVREGALRALGKLDAGQGVPTLMEALDDDRARVAVYALRSAVLAMPAAHALALLQSVRPTKVTVAKEYARLMGELPAEEAFRELLRLDGEELHRDVRGAVLRALWGHLERPEAWPVLERAAGSPDPALLNSVVRIPADRLSESSQARLLGLLVRALAHPEPLVRLQVLQRCASLPVPDPDQVLLPKLLGAVGSLLPDERQAAAGAVVAVCRPQDARAVGRAVGKLMANRRALLAAVDALTGAVGGDRRRLGPVARAVLATLAADPLCTGVRVGLTAKVLPWQELAELFKELAKAGGLHADALLTSASAIAGLADGPDAGHLEDLEGALALSRDERLRRLAVAALVAQARRPGGWSEERLSRLRAYREDRAPLVAAAAQFTLPAEEVPPPP